MGKNNNYGLVVGLSEAEANAITEHVSGPYTSTEGKLGVVATGLLRDLVKGGVMIGPEWATRIETAIGTTEAQAIVEAVERVAGKIGEATIVPWIVDPTQLPFYQSLADNRDFTLAQQLKAVMDYAYEQGWFGMGAPDPFKILLTAEQWRALQQIFGKDIVTGQDVMDRLGTPEVGTFAPEDGDLILDSLKG